jgi:hypothetical protein
MRYLYDIMDIPHQLPELENWIIYIWDTNQSFHTEKGVIFFLNCYSWKTVYMLIEMKRNSLIKIREKPTFDIHAWTQF